VIGPNFVAPRFDVNPEQIGAANATVLF
jgi:hypothetical protein